MAILASDVVRRSRTEILMDTDSADYRWGDDVMVKFANETAFELMRLKKHLLISEAGDASRSDDKANATYSATGISGTFPFPKKYEEPMIHGVSARCFLQDASDQANAARAQYHRSRFYELLGIQTVASTN